MKILTNEQKKKKKAQMSRQFLQKMFKKEFISGIWSKTKLHYLACKATMGFSNLYISEANFQILPMKNQKVIRMRTTSHHNVFPQ